MDNLIYNQSTQPVGLDYKGMAEDAMRIAYRASEARFKVDNKFNLLYNRQEAIELMMEADRCWSEWNREWRKQ